ncbi:hypothetical protein ACFQ61_27980 [Streptomyces sp. NPDC056500]|uniref:hypothetical protein n=1 Tax=Streptomyces sp. NPDC056500 TaxID=3345840 RepID=UPI00367D24C2
MRRCCQGAQEQYRAAPRATLISLDERVTPGEVHPARLKQPEDTLAFLCVIGLSPVDAIRVRARLLLGVFANVLLVDYRYDRGDETERPFIRRPVPAPLLDAHPELNLPNARAAAGLPLLSGDEYFDQLVDDALVLIEHKVRPGR